MITADQIIKLVIRIAEYSSPERMILFGSYARGTPHEDSDVDLLVIKRFRGPPQRITADILRHLHPGFPIDVIVRTPAQVRDRIEMEDYFMREITSQGIVLYEAGNTRVGQEGRRRLRHRLAGAPVAQLAKL